MSIKPSLYKILTIKKDGRSADFRLAATSIDFYEDICPNKQTNTLTLHMIKDWCIIN